MKDMLTGNFRFSFVATSQTSTTSVCLWRPQDVITSMVHGVDHLSGLGIV